MNEFAPGTGKTYTTFAQHAERDPHEFDADWLKIRHMFGGTPNPHALFASKTDSDLMLEYAVESIGVREYLSNLFLADTQRTADVMNMMIRYRKSAGDDKMNSVVYAVKNTDRPFDGEVFKSQAHDVGRRLPALDESSFSKFEQFLEPSLRKVSSGRFKTGGRRDSRFIYGALPLTWTLDLMASATKTNDQEWTNQINCRQEWFWIASAFELMKQVGKGVAEEKFPYMRVSFYVLGDYFSKIFEKMGVDNVTAEDAKQFGYKMLRTYDYASTAKALMLMKEQTRSHYFSNGELSKLKMSYEDALGVLDYPERVSEYIHKSGSELTKAEKELCALLQIDEIKRFVRNFAETKTRHAVDNSSVNVLETNFDNKFTLRQETGTFVKSAVLEGVAKEVGINPVLVPA